MVLDISYNQDGSGLSRMINVLSSESYKLDFKLLSSIHVREGRVKKLDIINDFLTMNRITEQRLFVYIEDTEVKLKCISNDEMDNFLAAFLLLCKNTFTLLINEQLPINIGINVDFIETDDSNYNIKNVFDKCNSTFLSYFDDTKLLPKYKQPKCNYHTTDCESLMKPYTLFACYDWDDEKWCTFNVSNVN